MIREGSVLRNRRDWKETSGYLSDTDRQFIHLFRRTDKGKNIRNQKNKEDGFTRQVKKLSTMVLRFDKGFMCYYGPCTIKS